MLKPTYFGTSEEELTLEQQGGTVEERLEKLLELKDVHADGFNPINFQAAVEHVIEKSDKKGAKGLLDLMTGAMGETLQAAIDDGPLEDGDVPSKAGRDDLMKLNLMVAVAGKGGTKLNAATMLAATLRDKAGVEDKDDD